MQPSENVKARNNLRMRFQLGPKIASSHLAISQYMIPCPIHPPRLQSPCLEALTLRRRARAGQAIAANGNPLSGASASIPSTTTEHEQVPTSITKKHNMSMCYRRRAVNVGGNEMVLGRICNQSVTTINRMLARHVGTIDRSAVKSVCRDSCKAAGGDVFTQPSNSIDYQSRLCGGRLDCLFPQSVNCFHSGFRGDTTVETDANVASVGFDSRMRGNQCCVGASLTFNHDLMKDSAVIQFPASRQAILVKHNVI